jgi:hypothetical protein
MSRFPNPAAGRHRIQPHGSHRASSGPRPLRQRLMYLALGLFAGPAANLVAEPPAWPDAQQWPQASPEKVGMSSQRLEDAARLAITPIGDAIVIRRGYDVWRYGEPYGKTSGWWASTARSYLTTVFAMLIQRGVIPGGRDAVEIRVNQLPSATARSFKDDVRLKHLLSYTSCATPAGSEWQYGCNWVPMHAIFVEITGRTPWDYINAELKPIIGGAAWQAIEQRDGTLRVVGPPPDMARWGYLWLRGGRWKATQVIDAWLVDLATDPMPKPDGTGVAHPNEGWQIHTNDGGVWPGLPRDSYAALGANATSAIWVSPGLDLVIARLGDAPKEHDRIDEFLAPIVAAVESPKPLHQVGGDW